MSSTIENCLITNGESAEIIRGYIDKGEQYHTGIDITANEVYSICQGIVIDVGKNSDGYAVTVQNNQNECVRYMHLKKSDVKVDEYIYIGTFIGLADKFVHFEYITDSQSKPVWPVRINKLTYYKKDPTEVLTGIKKLSMSAYINESEAYQSTFTADEWSEFSNGGSPDEEFYG